MPRRVLRPPKEANWEKAGTLIERTQALGNLVRSLGEWDTDELREAARLHEKFMEKHSIPFRYAAVVGGRFMFPLVQRLMNLEDRHKRKVDFNDFLEMLPGISRRQMIEHPVLTDFWHSQNLRKRPFNLTERPGYRDIDVYTLGIPAEQANFYRERTKGKRIDWRAARKLVPNRLKGLKTLDFHGHATDRELDEAGFVYAEDVNSIPGFNVKANPDNPRAGRHLAALFYRVAVSKAIGATSGRQDASERLREQDEKRLLERVKKLPSAEHVREFNTALDWLLRFHAHRMLYPRFRGKWYGFGEYARMMEPESGNA
ncbi:MAG: hypothetical protein V1708_04115 [Candidatus Micrarchaeota archaeon]